MSEYSRFIETIKAALLNERYTARQLALAIGVNPSYITRVLAGERNPPSDELIEKIAQVLNLNPDRLLWEAGRLPGFLRTAGPLSDEDLKALRRSYERIKQRHLAQAGSHSKK